MGIMCTRLDILLSSHTGRDECGMVVHSCPPLPDPSSATGVVSPSYQLNFAFLTFRRSQDKFPKLAFSVGHVCFPFQLETPFQSFGTRFLASFSLRWSLGRNFSFPPNTAISIALQSQFTYKLDLFPILRKKCPFYILTLLSPLPSLPALTEPNLFPNLKSKTCV